MVTKNHILDEIKRTAEENKGLPFGSERFFTVTGIKEGEWRGRYWANWGDALAEAGFARNRYQVGYEEDFLLDKLTALSRELGHFPTQSEIRLKTRSDNSFPSDHAFRRLGTKKSLAAKLVEYCRSRTGYEDVAAFCAPHLERAEIATDSPANEEAFGYVYLLKSGKYYKIGMSNAVGRREYELNLNLPEKPTLLHKIKTDDPIGIEKYWHKRFADKRRDNSEFFKLLPQDVAAFKRRKFM